MLMKYLLFIISIIFTCATLFAQPVEDVSDTYFKNQIGLSFGKSINYSINSDGSSREKTPTLKRLGLIVNAHYQHSFNKYVGLRVELLYQKKRNYIYWRPFPYTYSIEGIYTMRERVYASIPLFLQLNINRFFTELGIAVSCDFGSTYYSFSSLRQWKMDKSRSGGDWDFIVGSHIGFGYLILQKERFSISLKLRNEQDVLSLERKSIKLTLYPYNTTSLLAGFNYKL